MKRLLGLGGDQAQLELSFTQVSPRDARELLQRLTQCGLRGITSCRLTSNRTVMVSFRGTELRVHRGFLDAPETVLRAIAIFVSGRGTARRAARSALVAHPIERAKRTVRREGLHLDDVPLARKLTDAHARLNAQHFGGALRAIDVRVSRRMKSRLGHYASALVGATAGEIVISRRHLRRHGWHEALDTLLHEMVHQWQDETGRAIDHGQDFRRKAREVGATPSAKRLVGARTSDVVAIT